MRWRESGEVRWLEADLPGAVASFSTRLGGTSSGPFESLNLGVLTGDDRDAVLANRRLLDRALEVDPASVLIGRQVHGAEVLVHERPQEPAAWVEPVPDPPRVDGHVSAAPGLAPLVFVADCLPIALAGPGGVAMLHGGWRGLVLD